MKQEREKSAWEWLFRKKSSEEICKELEQSGRYLFRYSEDCPEINREKWRYILQKSWKTGGHFPTLYRVCQIYDKREVVMCFLMSADLSMEEADQFLEQISVNEQNYDNRGLYPLHYKEGFFRLVISWNEKREEKLSFGSAMEYYKKYEKEVGRIAEKQAENILDKKKKLPEKDKLEKYKNIEYYCTILEPLLKQLQQWKSPYTLRQQDILQRMLVLCSLAERAQYEYDREENPTIMQYNTRTRRISERGTRLCMDLVKRCIATAEFQDALKYFIENAVPVMGEAYWRSFSAVMKSYAESGGRRYASQVCVEERIFSKKNPNVKEIKKIPLFEVSGKQTDILSLALKADSVKEYIQKESANTVLLAELFKPVDREAQQVFETQKAVSNYSAIGEFLGSYIDWLEGKLTQKSGRQIREPMPYYRFKRKTVLKYALACGCTSEEEIGNYLEFTGNSQLNQDIPTEQLVLSAIEEYKKQMERIPLIDIIRRIQQRRLYQEAEKYVKEKDGTNLEYNIRKNIRKLIKTFLYEPSIESFGRKENELTKQKMLEQYYIQLLLCDMIMIIGKPIALDNEETEYDEEPDFLIWMDQPEEMVENYIKDYMEDKEERQHNSIRTDNHKLIPIILRILKANVLPLERIYDDNALELKKLYIQMLKAVAQISYSCKDCEVHKNLEYLKHWLTDACTAWTFHGGCQNFRIGWYEKKLRLNHYKPSGKSHESIPEDSIEWNRWTYIYRNKEQLKEMWEMLIMDVKIIRRCHRYLNECAKELIDEKDCEIYRSHLKEVVEEYQGQCAEISRNCMDSDMEELLVILESKKKELFF